jgi:hypothetical protein
MNTELLDLDEIHQRRARNASSILKRRVPVDIEEANAECGANCGPAALAAVLGVDVSDVMGAFPQFPDRTYTNASDMGRALEHEGYSFEVQKHALPKKGVSLIQFVGSWGDASSSNSSALKRTHWIAVDRDLVFDLNWGSWLTLRAWEFGVLPMFQLVEPGIMSWEPRLSYVIA